MATGETHRAPHEIIEAERIVYEDLHDHIFDLDFLMQDVYRRCGCLNHNISCRFKHFVGRAPKAHVVYHRVALAKRLLHHKHLTVAQVAFAVGYASPNGFSTTFKRQVGVSPTAFRRILRQDL